MVCDFSQIVVVLEHISKWASFEEGILIPRIVLKGPDVSPKNETVF